MTENHDPEARRCGALVSLLSGDGGTHPDIREGAGSAFCRELQGQIRPNRAAGAQKPGPGGDHGVFQIDAEGKVELLQTGYFPHADGPQKIELEDLEAIVAGWRANGANGEALVDFDHESYDPAKRTTAAGWLSNPQIQAREIEDPDTGAARRVNSLVADVRWSTAGLAALRGGEYRSLSPWLYGEEDENGDFRPRLLDSAGLTNRPNIKTLRRVANREKTGAQDGGHQTDNQTQQRMKKEHAELLGVAADATDEQISEAIRGMATRANRAATLEGELTEARKDRDELADELAAADVREHGDVIADKEKAQAAFRANREETRSFYRNLRESAAKPADKGGDKPIHRGNRAGTPDLKGDAKNEGSEGDVIEQLNGLDGAERTKFYRANREAILEAQRARVRG